MAIVGSWLRGGRELGGGDGGLGRTNRRRNEISENIRENRTILRLDISICIKTCAFSFVALKKKHPHLSIRASAAPHPPHPPPTTTYFFAKSALPRDDDDDDDDDDDNNVGEKASVAPKLAICRLQNKIDAIMIIIFHGV